MTERDLIARLRAHFAPPAWAFLDHVRNGTGWSRRTTRTADGIAMSLWPSRGLDLHGFEVKGSRSDWLRERDDPAKADEIAARCDRWWVVVSDAEIVKAGELPSPWGLLVAKGSGLEVVKEPTAYQEPQPIDRAFLAAILRRASEAQARPEPTAGAIERARTAEGCVPAEEDFVKLRARMERLHTTAQRLVSDIGIRMYDLQRAERHAKSLAEIDADNERLEALAAGGRP